MYSSRQFPICVECDMKQINEPITDPEYKKLFDLPLEIYEKSSFLRSIKKSYLRYKTLTDKQLEIFKKVAQEMKSGGKQEEKDEDKNEDKDKGATEEVIPKVGGKLARSKGKKKT